MTSLDVADGRNFAYALSHRLDELKSLQLTHLKLKLQPLSHEELRVKPFLEQLSKLVSLELNTKDLSNEQVELFVELQEVPSHFTVKYRKNIVEFVRVN